MKKLTLIALVMMALIGINANAAVYLVGNEPLGNGWVTNSGVEMTDNGDGIYTYTTAISGSVWFCFADGLVTDASDWNGFNQYRIAPVSGDVTVEAGQTVAATRGGGSYKFTGTGNEYTITFDMNTFQFTIEGYVAPITLDCYTVAGTPASIFGTEWAPGNTDNDMVLGDDGIYTLTKTGITLYAGTTISFKVTSNHSWDYAWPESNYGYYIEESGTYDIVFTFNPENTTVGITVTKQGDSPVIEDTYTVAGAPAAVFGNEWDPNDTNNDMVKGDDGIYTLTKSGIELTSADDIEFKVVANRNWSTCWPIDNWYYDVTADGTYDIVFTFNPETTEIGFSATLTSTPEPEHYTGDIYILGEVSEVAGWYPNQGVKMTRDEENNVYTAEIYTEGQNDGYSYFSFSKILASSETAWEELAGQRIGADADGDFEVVLNTPMSLRNGEAAFKIPAGIWDLELSVDNMTLTVYEVLPTVVRGDVNGDESIDPADISALIDYLLNGSAVVEANADCDQNGDIDPGDISALIDYLLNDNWPM